MILELRTLGVRDPGLQHSLTRGSHRERGDSRGALGDGGLGAYFEVAPGLEEGALLLGGIEVARTAVQNLHVHSHVQARKGRIVYVAD